MGPKNPENQVFLKPFGNSALGGDTWAPWADTSRKKNIIDENFDVGLQVVEFMSGDESRNFHG